MERQREAQVEAASAPHQTARVAATPRRVHPVLRLQRAAGNQAVQHLIQTKLTVNEPGDVYEQEADRVAEQVMRMPARLEPIDSGAAQVQRKCACGGTCDSCKAGRIDEEHGTVQRKPPARPQIAATGSSAATTAMNAPPIVHEVLSSPGQPLGTTERAFMEPRFGQDFSGVRVHTGAKAAASAAAVQARAYTVGNNIVFGGKESASDLPVLAHELTHVVQQSGLSWLPDSLIQRSGASCTDLAAELFARTGNAQAPVCEEPPTPRQVGSLVETEIASFGGYENAGARLKEVKIPGANKAPRRNEDPNEDYGYADLVEVEDKGTYLEVKLAEIKPLNWEGLLNARSEAEHYADHVKEEGKYCKDLDPITAGLPANESLRDFCQKVGALAGTPKEVRLADPKFITWAPPQLFFAWFSPYPLIEAFNCGDGAINYRCKPEEEEQEDKKPDDKEPKDKEPKDNGPGPSPISSLPELFKLGAKVWALLATPALISAALSFVGSLAVALTPLLALAALAVGIVFLWDKIKSFAHMIAGVAKFVWDKVSAVVALVRDTIKEIGIKIGELAVWVGGLIKDIAEKIAEGLLWVGRRVIEGAEWLGGKIAEGAEAVWDWLFGSDVEPMMPNVELPITEEPTMRSSTVAREDTFVKLGADLLFDTAEWELKPEADTPLKAAEAKVLSFLGNSNDLVRIDGYTDNRGGFEYNQDLSEKRAGAVAKWFVERGVLESRIKITGWGKTRAQYNDPKGREKDRRVEIWVITNDATTILRDVRRTGG